MKKLALPFLLFGLASAMLVASPALANDKTDSGRSSTKQSRPCKKVKIAIVSRSGDNDKPANATSSEPYFNNEWSAQHPSGGG